MSALGSAARTAAAGTPLQVAVNISAAQFHRPGFLQLVQAVLDETGYLDSLGRPQIAAVLRDAENAENEAQQEITRAQATSAQRSNVAKAQAETHILEKQNELRQVKAELEVGRTRRPVPGPSGSYRARVRDRRRGRRLGALPDAQRRADRQPIG